MKYLASLLIAISIISTAAASTYAPFPFTDIAFVTMSQREAINSLYSTGIMTGNADGTFAPNREVNRAEFLTLTMRMQSYVRSTTMPASKSTQSCFADVLRTDWFADAVCFAKNNGIIEGVNRSQTALDADVLFTPNRGVLYAEALKMLLKTFNIPLHTNANGSLYSKTGQWYDVYMQTDAVNGVLLRTAKADTYLNRAQTAELLSVFMQRYKLVRTSSSISSVTSSSSSFATSSAVSSNTSSSISSINSNAVYDSDAYTTVQSNFAILGQTSPALGGMKVFSEAQPLQVREFIIDFVQPVPSVSSLKIYDSTGLYVGTASRVTPTSFVATVSSAVIKIPQKIDTSFYARATVKSRDGGGVSGEIIQLSRFGVKATGVWNTEDQYAYTNETFPSFQTALSAITVIKNGSTENDVLIAGTALRLGAFTFAGNTYDPSATLAIESLTVQADTSSNVQLSDVFVLDPLSGTSVPCTLINFTITCPNITRFMSTLDSVNRTLQFFGAIVISNNEKATLQLRLNQPGSVSTPGAITWTDGTHSFSWVAGFTPIARSTLFTR